MHQLGITVFHLSCLRLIEPVKTTNHPQMVTRTLFCIHRCQPATPLTNFNQTTTQLQVSPHALAGGCICRGRCILCPSIPDPPLSPKELCCSLGTRSLQVCSLPGDRQRPSTAFVIRLCILHHQPPAIQVGAAHALQRVCCLLLGGELQEGKTPVVSVKLLGQPVEGEERVWQSSEW